MSLDDFDEIRKVIEKETEIFKKVYDHCQGKNIHQREFIVAIYREVATDLRGQAIREQREMEKFVTVRVRDGESRKTIDVREDLKKLGFHFDADKKLWYRKMKKKTWLSLMSKVPEGLRVEVRE